jgi:hypothetical protein
MIALKGMRDTYVLSHALHAAKRIRNKTTFMAKAIQLA